MQALISKIHQLQDIGWVKKLSEYTFFLAVLIEIFIVLVDKSQLMNPFEGRLFQITFALCVIKVICTKYEWREYLTVFLFCLLGLAIDYFGDRNEILRAFMFIAACKGVDMKKCLRYVFWVTLFGCLVIVFLSVTGIYGDIQVPKLYDDGSLVNPYEILRYCFGMGNPNSFHIMIFALTVLGMYVYSKKITLWMEIGLLVLDVIIFYLARCKTAALLMAMTIIAFALVKYFKESTKLIFDKLCLVISVFSVGLSVFFASLGKEIYTVFWIEPNREATLLFKIDRMLTGRILSLVETENWDGAIESWKWFTVSGHERFFDLGFVRMFYWYGIIPTVIILLVFVYLFIFFIKEKKHEELVFLSLIAIFTVVESHFVSVYIGRCYPLFILGEFWPSLLSIGKGKDEQQLVQIVSETE